MSSNQERVVLLTTAHNTAAEKLDYFILGVSLAICAYLAQTNPYGRIGLNRETFLLGSLLVFAASAVFGFLRIQSTIADVRQNAFALEEQDPKISKLRIPRHPATQPTNIRPPVPRSSGQAVGAQRRRFALLV